MSTPQIEFLTDTFRSTNPLYLDAMLSQRTAEGWKLLSQTQTISRTVVRLWRSTGEAQT
jgi:hypothetical protein